MDQDRYCLDVKGGFCLPVQKTHCHRITTSLTTVRAKNCLESEIDTQNWGKGAYWASLRG